MNTLDNGKKTVAVDAGLAVLRVALAVVFCAHGAQKAFQYGIAGVTQGFSQAGIPLPGVAAPFVTGLELIGGTLLLLGLFTRPVALLLAIDMLVATLVVHLPNGFFNPMGIEFTMILFAGTLALVMTGPGDFSLDALLAKRRRGHAVPATL
jgi:putative oxidoreductase